MHRRRGIYNTVELIAYSNAVVGNILCSDLTIISTANYSRSGKTAIGIVYRNAANKLDVMALTSAAVGSLWWGGNADVPTLDDYNLVANAETDFANTTNTTALITFYGTGTNYAFKFCRDYSTTGTTVGQWDLPAYGNLNLIVNTNFTTLNATLSVLGESVLSNDIYYWSSTQYGLVDIDWYAWYAGRTGRVFSGGAYKQLLSSASLKTLPVITISY